MVRKQMKMGVNGKYTLYNLGEFEESIGEFDHQEGEGIFDVFKNVGTKIAAKLTGKAAKEIATKAATKAFEKGAEKVGEKTGQLIGEKIYNKFTDKSPQVAQPQVAQPNKKDIGTQLMKDLQKDKSWLPPTNKPGTKVQSSKREKALIDVFDELFLQ